jgi:hypothetical protein
MGKQRLNNPLSYEAGGNPLPRGQQAATKRARVSYQMGSKAMPTVDIPAVSYQTGGVLSKLLLMRNYLKRRGVDA